jgi:putative component of membrane protein insertase Oxa1/YidC/SpoIIIJ protein YidD
MVAEVAMSCRWTIGALFFCAISLHAATSDLALATALAGEGDWSACRLECRRVVVAHPGHTEAARLLARAETELAGVKPAPPWWKRLGALPVKGLVGFYRLAVAPALGSRCVLEPSCSRYSMQAALERGWLGLPMTADRLIREPSVVNEGAHPITDAQGRIRYADPVSDHVGGSVKSEE